MLFPRLIIAGVRGGSGKTTLSLSLITAFRALRGLKVVPFKKGPDYMDAGWMSLAARSPCYNLDPFLIPNDKILQSFSRHSTGDIAVIEGNRGLYDGLDAAGSSSTAELGKLLKAPVILVLDCSKMTRTARLPDLLALSVDDAMQILDQADLLPSAGRLRSEIIRRLEALRSVGLGPAGHPGGSDHHEVHACPMRADRDGIFHHRHVRYSSPIRERAEVFACPAG